MTPRRRANLKRLLAPRHAAFIGGSDAAIAAAQCAAMGFEGPVWGVNPHRKELGGYPCFANLEALPEAPDAVFLAVPRTAAVETVAALRRRGSAGVVHDEFYQRQKRPICPVNILQDYASWFTPSQCFQEVA